MKLKGNKLAGGNPKNERVENDYYATNPKALKALLERESFDFSTFLEPCVGEGHLANVVNSKNGTYIDIVDRGFPNTIEHDFLEWECDNKFSSIITNPPYSLAKEFVEKGMSLLSQNGKMAMFLKIQFLEGVKRIDMFTKYSPKYIYVFTKRMSTWNNGNELDTNGKRWATTMTHAWFVWENGYIGEPIIRWI